MKPAKMRVYCEECCIGFDITFLPCIGLEVKRHVTCPDCSTEHTVTVRVDVEAEERRAT